MNLIEELSRIPDCVVTAGADLTSFTTMRLASQGDLLELKSVAAVQAALPVLKKHQRDFLVVGWGANQILPPLNSKIILHLDLPFDPSYLDELKPKYDFPASVGLNHLTAHAVRFGLRGWEVFTGIPASLGGAIYMNAGTNLGEIGDLIASVTLVNEFGMIREENISKRSFSYRHNHFIGPGEVVVGATVIHHGQDPAISQKIKEYLDYRKKSQPLATRNCGCVFKNPQKELQAGRLIDLMGLKGLSHGGLRVSPKHANFIENTGASSWDQFKALTGLIRSTIDAFYGIEFELEVKIPYD